MPTGKPAHASGPWIVLACSQIAWFAAVIGGAKGIWWPGVCAVGVVVALHLALVERRDAWRVALSLPLGFAADGLLGGLGVATWPRQGLPPVWLTALWPNFAVLLRGCLAWLVRQPLALSAAFGALGGPAAYLGGQRLGAVSFPHGPLTGLLSIGLLWALACPLMVLQARRMAGAGT